MYPTYASSSSFSSSSPSTTRYSSSIATVAAAAAAGYSDYGIRSTAAAAAAGALQQQYQRQNNNSLPSVYRNNNNNNNSNSSSSSNRSSRNGIFVYDFDTEFERTILERVEREYEALEKRRERWRERENQLQLSNPTDNRSSDVCASSLQSQPPLQQHQHLHHHNRHEDLDFESRCKSLCVELGYDESMAEFALSAYKDEEMKVLDLITKMDQLLRFGYREQDVKEALIVSDREINAALDYLAKK